MIPRLDEFECQVKGHGHHAQETGFLADISGIAELICDKFTWKTYLVTRSDKFEDQGQFRWPACGLCLVNIFGLVQWVFPTTYLAMILTINKNKVSE